MVLGGTVRVGGGALAGAGVGVVLVTLLVALPALDLGHVHGAAGQVDVDAALVGLGVVLQAHLATDLFDFGLDLLYMAGTVVAPAHDHVQVRLALSPGVADALLHDVLRLLHELAVQVDGVGGHPAGRVVLPEDEVRGLFVVFRHLAPVGLAFLAQRVRRRAVASLVGLLRLIFPPHRRCEYRFEVCGRGGG